MPLSVMPLPVMSQPVMSQPVMSRYFHLGLGGTHQCVTLAKRVPKRKYRAPSYVGVRGLELPKRVGHEHCWVHGR